MGTKSSYFRHGLQAHQDEKIIKLIEKHGAKGYGVWNILLETYGTAVLNDDKRGEIQQISARRLAANCKLRADSVHKIVEFCNYLNLSGHLLFNSDSTMIELSIPNYFKYFGKYKKTESMNCPNKRKENKRKENKRKEKRNTLNTGVINSLKSTTNHELLDTVSHKTQERWISEYDLDAMNNEFEKITVYLENSNKAPSNMGLFITNWFKRSGLKSSKDASNDFKKLMELERELF